MELHSKKKSPKDRIFSSPVLKPRLVNNTFAFCFLINLAFLATHIAHLDNIIVLPLPVFKTFGFMFSVFFLHFKQ